MKTAHDYESLGTIQFHREEPALMESYSGTAIVQWYGNIERQLQRLIDDAEKGRNWPYLDKLREFIQIWRDNEITGSLNRETIQILKAACDILAVDSWNLGNYFSNLRDQLRKVIASEEELPRDVDMSQNEPLAGGAGGRSAPPMNPSFGPEDQPPGQENMPPEGPEGGPETPEGSEPPTEPGGPAGSGSPSMPGGPGGSMPDDNDLERV